MKTRPNPLCIPVPKRRNPVALAARQRQAGAHGRQGGAARQDMRRDLRRELQHLDPQGP